MPENLKFIVLYTPVGIAIGIMFAYFMNYDPYIHMVLGGIAINMKMFFLFVRDWANSSFTSGALLREKVEYNARHQYRR